MFEMYKILINNKLTPNQFYLLWSINEGLTTPIINTELELRRLKKINLVLNDNTLSADAKKIIKEVEAYFKIVKQKTNYQLMGSDFKGNMKKFNEIYPNRKLPSGSPARSAIGNLEPAFRWFFQNYEYDWETIFEATKVYIDERERENWNYTIKSAFFIRKQNVDKSWQSTLADFCLQVEEGLSNDGEHFSEKIY